jgi:transglutaminase-like putative cysteine protease
MKPTADRRAVFRNIGLIAVAAGLALLPACMAAPPGSLILPTPYNPPPPGQPLTLERVVRFEHRQVNASDRPADVELFLAVPRDNERQAIRYFQADPGYVEEITDEYGNRILHYRDRRVPPGEVVAHGWMAEVSVSSLVHEALPASRRQGLTAEQRERFLRDGENYQITAPAVRDLARSLAASNGRAEETARNIFDHLIHTLHYERDDVWDPAPVVLARGSGSCSEYNYAFVALCRAAGIPARYTGGIVLSRSRVTRYDPEVTEDAVFHRWSEVFLPGRGWIPVDCSRASGEVARFGNPANYYGRLPAGVLQCVRGDGLGQTPLGWDYLSQQRLPYPEEKDWSGKVAFWIDGIEPGALAARAPEVEKRLAGVQDRALFDDLVRSSLDREILFLYRNRIRPEALGHLVAALRHAGHPEAVYFSVLAGRRGVDLPPELGWSNLSDPVLKEEIEKYLKPASGGDLFTFEYWWRKARPVTRWDKNTKRFVLTTRKINIY